MKKEYYYTDEVARMLQCSVKTIIRRINDILIENEDTKLIIKKDRVWLIHSLAIPKFTKETTKYHAITIDTVIDYNEKDLISVIKLVFDNYEGELELNYTIEAKNKNNKPHIHCYIPTTQLYRFKKALLRLVEFSYHIAPVYDLEGWRNYISKENNITTLKKLK